MKRRNINFPVKPLLIAVLALLVAGLIFWSIWSFLTGSDYFKINNIITREANSADLSYLEGKNIFSIDLKNESLHILQFYPDCSRIYMIKILPNRLFVGFIKRKPIAFVKLNKFYAIDNAGTLFFASGEPAESDLPLITGLETKILSPQTGKKYNVPELKLALSILNEIKKNKGLKNYKFKKIDVSNANNMYIFIPFPIKVTDGAATKVLSAVTGLDVKISANDIPEKIAILSGLIQQYGNDLTTLKYIDLRFKDPAIKFNDVKNK